MFEIGPALREARERRGISLTQVEADTKIRARYIRALEDEDFGVLPGKTYTKGFLRAYADYLGMDGQLFIDEFNSRHIDPRFEEEIIYPRPRSRPRPRHRRESSLVMIALAAIVAVSAIVFLGFLPDDPPTATIAETEPAGSGPPAGGASERSGPARTGKKDRDRGGGTAAGDKRRERKQKKQSQRFVMQIATSGLCWMEARRTPGGEAFVSTRGTPLGGYTLQPGETVSVRSVKPVYLRLGAPSGVTVTVNGRPVPLPPASTGALLRVSRQGIVPVAA
jgi:cytoskeleton protein RodZ